MIPVTRMAQSMTPKSTSRVRGITLLEVLISLGILSVGLASVLALIPAGGSQTQRALIEDRRGAMAAAACADAINLGLLQPHKWNRSLAAPYYCIFDPVGNGSFTANLDDGIQPFKAVDLGGLPAGSVEANDAFRLHDDLTFIAGTTEDAPPLPRFLQGTAGPARRFSEGTFSWLATLATGTTGAPNYVLSIVQFHRRPASPSANVNPATRAGSVFTLANPITEELFRDFFPVGGAVLLTNPMTSPAIFEWRRIVMASPIISAGLVTGADLEFDRDPSPNATHLHAIEGTVGLTERFVQLEGISPWSQ